MKIELHIDRLVLEGLPVGSTQSAELRDAIQRELVGLLSANGLSQELRGGISVPRIRAGSMEVGQKDQPVKLGKSIAQAVHAGIGSSKDNAAANKRQSSVREITR